jgi:signal transduction histidine kinase
LPARPPLEVRVDPDAGGVSVRIIDDGTPGGPSGPGVPGSGAGLTGMRERATGCGGRLRFGAIEGGGWQVHLWVPVAGPVA